MYKVDLTHNLVEFTGHSEIPPTREFIQKITVSLPRSLNSNFYKTRLHDFQHFENKQKTKETAAYKR